MTATETIRTRATAATPLHQGRCSRSCWSPTSIVLDNSIIFTDLPDVQAGLDLPTTGLAWAQNAYALVFGGLLLLGARAGDLLGRTRVFTT